MPRKDEKKTLCPKGFWLVEVVDYAMAVVGSEETGEKVDSSIHGKAGEHVMFCDYCRELYDVIQADLSTVKLKP